jgi:hypothetical protein
MSTVEKCHNCADLRAKLQAAESEAKAREAALGVAREQRDRVTEELRLTEAARGQAIRDRDKARKAEAEARRECDEARNVIASSGRYMPGTLREAEAWLGTIPAGRILLDKWARVDAAERDRDSARRELEAEKRRADEAVRHAETSDAIMCKARADEAQARQLIEAQTARAHESERRAAGLAEFARDVRDNYDCDESAHKYTINAAGCRRCNAREALAAFEALRDGGVK